MGLGRVCCAWNMSWGTKEGISEQLVAISVVVSVKLSNSGNNEEAGEVCEV